MPGGGDDPAPRRRPARDGEGEDGAKAAPAEPRRDVQPSPPADHARRVADAAPARTAAKGEPVRPPAGTIAKGETPARAAEPPAPRPPAPAAPVPAARPLADGRGTQIAAADAQELERAQRTLSLARVGAAAGRAGANAPLSAAALASPVLEEADRRDLLWFLSAALSRVTAMAWLAGTVVLWARLVGYGRTDIVPVMHDPGGPWLTTMTAALVFPVVAVGLWLLGRWGLVVWAAAIVAGGVLFALRPDLVPFGPLALAANLAAAVLVAALATLRAVRDHRAAE